jgi:OOP family OmpA-OmpF porin
VAGATAVLDPGPCILEIVLKTDTVGFAHDSATLSDAGVALVSGVAASIRTSTHALIVGYTSSEGPRAYNVGLSLRRAEAVRAVVGPLVPGIVLDVGGRGPDDPVASNATAEGRSANRRVVIQAKIKRPEC